MHPSTFSDQIITGGSPLIQNEPPLPHLVDPRASVNYQRTREMSIDELLLENRVVFLIGEINYSSAARIIMQMLYLENQKRGQDINLYINSPGGSVDDTLAIYDTMSCISVVATYCVGRPTRVRCSSAPARRASDTSCPTPR